MFERAQASRKEKEMPAAMRFSSCRSLYASKHSSQSTKYNVRRVGGALHLGTRDGPNRSARLVRRLRWRAPVGRAQGILLPRVLVGAPRDHRREMRLVRHAMECGRGVIPMHRLS